MAFDIVMLDLDKQVYALVSAHDQDAVETRQSGQRTFSK